MAHHHHHTHENLPHEAPHGSLGKTFGIGIALNLAFVGVEFFYGFISNGLSLIADAWHNLGDVLGLAISLLAFRMAEIKPNKKYTYGYSKGTILASLANSVLLLIAVGTIGYEAFDRFLHPVLPEWKTLTWVASLGILINSATAFLFMNKNELNSRAAYLHMAADAGVSAGVVLGGILIHFSGIYWIDPVISLFICAVILVGTWNVLKSSLRLSLDGVPENVDVEKVKETALKMPQIKDIHHMHIWAMSTTKNALTAHLMLHQSLSEEQSVELKNNLKHAFLHLNIQHATLELELHHTDDCEEC